MPIRATKDGQNDFRLLIPGDRLDLNDASARWLITQGTAKAATPATDSKPTRRDVTSGVSTTAATQGD